MAFLYFDTSALVKYYVPEPGSQWVRDTIDDGSNFVLVGEISIPEVAAAFAILYRTKQIRRSTWDGVYARFLGDMVDRFLLVRLAENDFFAAAELTRRQPLKAYDAIQLTLALRESQALNMAGRQLIFVTGDKTLLVAARAEGLATENPFDHLSETAR